MTDRPTLPTSLAAAIVACSLGFVPASADAFERTKTCGSYDTSPCDPGETPKAIYWPKRCVKYHVNESGTSDFPRDGNGKITEDSQLFQIVRTGFERWNKPECSDFTMVPGGLTDRTKAQYIQGEDRDRNINLLVWRDDAWPYNSRTTFALTSVTFTRDGKIVDADMEFNSALYDFAEVNPSTTPGETEKVDLLNTLMHEIGHFLGLDHPDVDENPAAIDATMYGEANTGETKKRTLEQDDINGLCAIYPAKSPPATCDSPEDFEDESAINKNKRRQPSGSACSTTPPRPSLPWLGAGLAVVIAGLSRRRRSE